jgi:uncharacterized protein
MLLVAAALSLLIGVVLGMLGGGGAILTLPMLVYIVGLEPKAAIATSLFVVGATSVFGAGVHARAKAVSFRIGGVFGIAAMVGAYGGGRIAHFIPANALLILFGAVMLVSAVSMLRPSSPAAEAAEAPAVSLRVPHALAMGGFVGILSGLVGAGGGFLIVPALILFGGLPVRLAIGTSLFVIATQSFAGFAGHAAHVGLDWPLVLGITAATVVGSVAGAIAGRRVSAAGLRRAFAWLVIAMGLFMLAKQLPPLAAVIAAVVTLAAVLLVTRRGRAGGSKSQPTEARAR